jgi:rieske iron-sulfur protein
MGWERRVEDRVFGAAAEKAAAERRGRCLSCRGGASRRAVLQTLVTGGLSLSLARRGLAEEERPGSDERPQPGDRFVFFEGEHQGQVVMPAALKRGADPVLAWPMDPKSKVVRNGSRLNQVLLLALDAASLDPETRALSANGIVAYSAICTHAGCTVTGWVRDQGTQVLKCPCHNSEYDPRRGAAVVFGPAPHHLAKLPVRVAAGALVVAKVFVGKVGPSQAA